MLNQSIDGMSIDSQFRFTSIQWVMLLLSIGLLGYVFFDGISYMVQTWAKKEEYSHGYMIPLVAGYLAWQKRDQLTGNIEPAWLSVALLALGLATFFLGELSSIYVVIQYAFLLSLFSLALSFLGWTLFTKIWVTFVYLVFMIPLPDFLYNNLSGQLQLISSAIGVYVVRLFGISVYLEGNVIDLGSYQLQVVEACSGLRYLFPLMSFGFLIAYMYKGALWQKAFLFLSTVPITVLMNSFRIGVIGVTVEYWGIEMADGFLHEFEGWVVFMGCLGVLLLEIACFHFFSKEKMSIFDRLDFDHPTSTFSLSNITFNKQSLRPFYTCFLLLVLAAAAKPILDTRLEIIPERSEFKHFPLYHGQWRGRESSLEVDILERLKLTDYIKAFYTNADSSLPVNLYIAYYGSQRKGASIHSPRSCIPGGGWQLEDLQERTIADVNNRSGEPLKVNRVIIRKNQSAQLVYYWFEQRGRNITNEYAAKWFIFWDALTTNRTDGALVRVVVPVPDRTKINDAEAKALEFIRDFSPLLPKYLPGKQ